MGGFRRTIQKTPLFTEAHHGRPRLDYANHRECRRENSAFPERELVAKCLHSNLAADGVHLLANRRLTLDENENIAFAWTPDSKAVVFHSDRNGTREIFKQAIDQPTAERLVNSPEQLAQPRVSPDGSEILYISTPKSAGPKTPSSIFAVPIEGGTPRLVLKDVGIWNLQCAHVQSTICLYSNEKATLPFDAKSGTTARPLVEHAAFNWSLSPDGSQRAVIVPGPGVGKIELRSTSTGKTRYLIVKGWNGLNGIDWSANGNRLLVTWHNFEQESALPSVALDGNATVLLKSSNPEIWGSIPSPDGRSLAINEAGGPKNVWQIQNF